MLLEVSRAKSPSAAERQAQTEEIMPTSVRRLAAAATAADEPRAERRSRPGPGSTTSPPRRRARAAGSRGTRRRVPRSCPGGSSPLFGTGAPDTCAVSVIGLIFNGIGDLGATELVSALLDNETLVRVDLRQNRIGDAGGGWTCARWSA